MSLKDKKLNDCTNVDYILTQVAQFSERATFSIGRLGVIFANETENYITLVSIVCATFSYPRQPSFQKSPFQDSLRNLYFVLTTQWKMML